jgi:hypothetical protein
MKKKIQINSKSKITTTMKNTFSILVALMVSIATTACANDESNVLATETRTSNAFYGVVLASDVNVVLSQDSEQSVRVEAAKADLPFINTKVINGSLVVSVRNNHKLRAPVNVYVAMTDVNLIEVIGNGKISSSEMINADMLTLKLKGNGSINVDVRAISVGANLNGCGTINISGSAANSLIKVYGQGHIITKYFSSFNTVEMIDDTPVDCTAMVSQKE